MKLQINNLEALERLIGNDNEIEMDIRQNIVEEFTRKHLKSLLTDSLLKKIGEAIKNEVEKEMVEKIRPSGSYYDTFRLTPKAAELVGNSIEASITIAVDAIVQERLQVTKLHEKVDKNLNRAVERITDYLADANLERILAARVDKKIKEKLGVS